MKELLLEIGVEELPAIPFLRELPNINAKWQAVLEKYNIKSEFTRRAVWSFSMRNSH